MDDIDKNCGNCRFYPECDFPECLVCPDWKEKDAWATKEKEDKACGLGNSSIPRKAKALAYPWGDIMKDEHSTGYFRGEPVYSCEGEEEWFHIEEYLWGDLGN